MLEIHLADDLSEHFINVRAMLGTGLNKRTAPYLGQSLQKIQSVSLLIRLISCFQNTTHHALNSWNFTLMLQVDLVAH